MCALSGAGGVGRKAIEKLEAKVMHLNAELDMENKFKADLNKKHNKAMFSKLYKFPLAVLLLFF